MKEQEIQEMCPVVKEGYFSYEKKKYAVFRSSLEKGEYYLFEVKEEEYLPVSSRIYRDMDSVLSLLSFGLQEEKPKQKKKQI